METTKTKPLTKDATKLLGCSRCPCNFSCENYKIACLFCHEKKIFSAKFLCILNRANYICSTVYDALEDLELRSVPQKVKTLARDFLPKINATWQAIELFEKNLLTPEDKQILISALYAFLLTQDVLDFYENCYGVNVTKLHEKLNILPAMNEPLFHDISLENI